MDRLPNVCRLSRRRRDVVCRLLAVTPQTCRFGSSQIPFSKYSPSSNSQNVGVPCTAVGAYSRWLGGCALGHRLVARPALVRRRPGHLDGVFGRHSQQARPENRTELVAG